MPEVVFDCCCLSNFALSGSMFILENLYGDKALVTEFVLAEVVRGIQSGHKDLERIQGALNKGWLRQVHVRRQEEKSLFETLSVSLGLGEASSIAVAQSRGFLLASDDRAARREAGLLGIKLTRTLGILRKAVKHNLVKINEADSLLSRMIKHGFFSSLRTLKNLEDAE
jgi:predicted nucleic acid-binding protein